MKPVERLLSRLQGIRRSGNGFVARCPAHDDRTPSLSITEGRDGRALLNCHAGCSPEQVLEALSLTWDDLFAEQKETTRRESMSGIAHTYDYTDADGRLLFQVVRYEPKGFRQRQPDGQGGWVWHVKGIQPVLYRLLEVLEAIAAGQTVFIVEGEKDVDTLRALGITATCNPMGAGKWRDDYAATLRGGHLVIVPDNDEAGQRHAEQVAQSCYDVADEVRILELPDLAEKGDVSDWIEAGGDAKSLLSLVEAAPVYAPASPVPDVSTDLLVIKTANQWMHEASVRPIPRMLFDEFWFEGELCILFADTNVGKSILAVQIADSVTSGRPIPGFRLEAAVQPVLYFDFELSDKQFEKRYSADYQNHYRFEERLLRVELNPETEFEGNWDKGVQEAIEQAAISTGARVLIVDNITYLKNETERAKHAQPLMRHLGALKKRHGLSIMALAHTPKRDPHNPIRRNDVQGSRTILQFADACFAIGESHQRDDARYLKQIKTRSGEFIYGAENVVLCRVEKQHNFLGFVFEDYGSEADHLKARTGSENAALDAEILALRQTEPELSIREIARRLNTNHTRVRRVLKRALTPVEQGGTGGTPGTPVPPVPDVPPGGDGVQADFEFDE